MKTLTKQRLLLAALVGVFVFFTAHHAGAALVTNKALISGDFISWAQLGPTLTNVTSPATVVSNSTSITATVTNETDNFQRRNQGSGWNGNFSPGDALLWTNNTPGPMDIFFATPVAGAGAQLQADIFGSFTATINVFNTSFNLVQSYTVPGVSSSAGDGSAIFLGVLDPTADISEISYSVVGGGTSDFAINQLNLNLNGGGNPVPEPGTMLLMGLGLAGAACMRRRQMKRAD